MGDSRLGGIPVEQVGYATSDNIMGPYTAYSNNPVIRFGTPGSFDAGTMARSMGLLFSSKYYIGYTVSPTENSPYHICHHNNNSLANIYKNWSYISTSHGRVGSTDVTFSAVQ